MRFSKVTLASMVIGSLCMATLVEGATITPGDIVNVDFNTTSLAQTPSGPVAITPAGTYSGAAAGPSAGGNFFNGLVLGDKDSRPTKVYGNYSSAPLLASDGATITSISVSLQAIDQYDTTENQAPSIVSKLLDDYAFAASNAAFTLHGLSVGATYDLYLYSQNGGYGSSTTTFTIDGISNTAANAIASVGSFTQGVNYVQYSGLTVGVSQEITGSFGSTGLDQGALNGFQIVQVAAAPLPDPAEGSLVLLAGLALTTFMRRRIAVRL